MSDSHIRVSEALMAELQRAADVEQRSPEEVVEDAIERYLRVKRRERLYAYGEGQAKRLGIEEEDVPALVKEIRRDTSATAKCSASRPIRTSGCRPSGTAGIPGD